MVNAEYLIERYILVVHDGKRIVVQKFSIQARIAEESNQTDGKINYPTHFSLVCQHAQFNMRGTLTPDVRVFTC